MKYSISKDIQVVSQLLNISYSALANELGVARSTIQRIVKNKVYPSDLFLESFYSFTFDNNYRPIRLNNLHVQLAIDEYDKVLFHGAKNEIEDVDLDHSRKDVDVGVGFYLGESFEQSSSYVFSNIKSSVYIFDARKLSNLKTKEFSVSLEWMLMVSYHRHQLDKYKNSSYLTKIIDELNDYDVIVAPIADNNMYDIMNQFARGDITDLQAISALSASHLGKQHVLKTKRACECLVMVDRLYLSKPERESIKTKNKELAMTSFDKAKLAIENNRRKGKYIEEILK